MFYMKNVFERKLSRSHSSEISKSFFSTENRLPVCTYIPSPYSSYRWPSCIAPSCSKQITQKPSLCASNKERHHCNIYVRISSDPYNIFNQHDRYNAFALICTKTLTKKKKKKECVQLFIFQAVPSANIHIPDINSCSRSASVYISLQFQNKMKGKSAWKLYLLQHQNLYHCPCIYWQSQNKLEKVVKILVPGEQIILCLSVFFLGDFPRAW